MAHHSPEAFLKKLVGRKDIDDALRRLDKLTQEEGLMITAESLKATQGVGDKVEDVHSRMKSVENRVEEVGNKIDGTQIVFNLLPTSL